jgi:hypothetical protein
MELNATVLIKDIYGKQTIYPTNKVAHLLAEIAGTKTLTQRTIDTAKEMGITFEVELGRIEL